MHWLADPQAWIALFTLTLLEIVLGIDNIIMLTILVSKLPQKDKAMARFFGLALAMGTRIALLLSLVWIMKLTQPLFSINGLNISGRDLILICGGLFLIAKSTLEIHQSMEGDHDVLAPKPTTRNHLLGIVVQIALVDIIFSLDSIITAVGLANQVQVMIIAIVLAVIVMMFAAKFIGDFVDAHPTIKILALSFLILIGLALFSEGFGFHIPKGYLYFAMAFSVAVEMLNLKMRKKKQVV